MRQVLKIYILANNFSISSALITRLGSVKSTPTSGITISSLAGFSSGTSGTSGSGAAGASASASAAGASSSRGSPISCSSASKLAPKSSSPKVVHFFSPIGQMD